MVCDLFLGYSTPDVDDVNVITGAFNARREGQAIMICDELSSTDQTYKTINMDRWNSPITGNTFVSNEKNMPTHSAVNINNFIITTNHIDSIRTTNDERRYQIINASDEFIGNDSYFRRIAGDARTEEVMNNLFTFFMNIDLSVYKDNTTKVIETEAAKEVREASKTGWEKFVEEFAEDFAHGWNSVSAYKSYVNYASENNYGALNASKFGICIKEFCDKHRPYNGGKARFYVYKLNDRYMKKFTEEGILDLPKPNESHDGVSPHDDDTIN